MLALGPHPDDIELGAGATIHKFVRDGSEVDAVIFSDCKDAVPPGWPPDSIREECELSMRRLGVARTIILDFKNKLLSLDRQSILDFLYEIRSAKYDLVLVGSSYSSHQDHIVVTEEARRAFRGVSIWGYNLPNSDYNFITGIYVLVSAEDVDAKIDSISTYKSQFELKRPYFNLDALKATLLSNGVEIGHVYAERFENIRQVVK